MIQPRLVVGLFSAVMFIGFLACTQSVPTVETDEYATAWASDSSHVLLDVRTEREWMSPTGHFEGAVLLPVQRLEAEPERGDQFKGKKVVVYCRTGNRSGRATALLRERGIEAYNLTGGITKWLAEGRPVVLEVEGEVPPQ